MTITRSFITRALSHPQNSTSRQIFNPKFEIPMGCFLFEYEFWQRLRQDLYVFCAKNCFRNAKFSEFGESWGWSENFLTKPPKGTSLPDFTRFEPSIVQIRSRVFAPGVCTKKKGHYKKSQRGYISRICAEFPTQPNSMKIGIRVRVADVINRTKFGNDR